jgi:hypothetical protein
LACGPRGGEVAGDLGPLRAREEEGEGEEGADARGQPGRARKERSGCSGWGKGSGPARGPCGGEREERGARGKKEERREKLGRANGVWVTALFSCFLFLFYTQTIQTNPFEFK